MVIPQKKRNGLGEPHNYPSLFLEISLQWKVGESKTSMIFINHRDRGQSSQVLASEVETPDSYRGVSSSIGVFLFR